ncbi:MAG: ECF transporter S component [Eubacteriales bacterium]
MSTAKTTPRKNVLFLAQFSMLLAIEAIVCFTPLGSLPAIGPIVATLSHVPVIITAILLGTGAGTAMGFSFGLFSFIVMTFTPPGPTAFVFTPFYSVGAMHGNFWSLVICFVPRILIGVVTGLSFKLLTKLFKKFKKKDAFVYGLSGFLGSATNTLLVLGGIYVFFGKDFASTIGTTFNLLLGIIGGIVLTSGIPEAVIGGVLAYAICRPLKHFLKIQSL